MDSLYRVYTMLHDDDRVIWSNLFKVLLVLIVVMLLLILLANALA